MEHGSQSYLSQGVNDLGCLHISPINHWVRGIILQQFRSGKHVDQTQANRRRHWLQKVQKAHSERVKVKVCGFGPHSIFHN